MKDFDTFSFKAKSERKRDSLHRNQDFQPPIMGNTSPKNWREMTYRYEKINKSMFKSPTKPLVYESHYINERIMKIDEDLTENIQRRIELQKKLYQEKQQIREKESQKLFKQNFVKTDVEVGQIYSNMQKKSAAIQNMLSRQMQTTEQQKYFRSIEKKQAMQQRTLAKKEKPSKITIVPDQLKIQKLLKSATFPQIPRCNLQKIEDQCQQMIINSQHSDLYYILMVISFHLGKFHNVRKYFREIQMYKIFQTKAYWVACETEFQLQSYDLCLKLADKCISQISDIHLPRFVYLQAKCYQKIGNFINSIVCYNQLIKMTPKISQLYLQRAMIYDKIGYPKQAKQDYIQFGKLQPAANAILKQKIICEKNQIKRKQMIKALAKIN